MNHISFPGKNKKEKNKKREVEGLHCIITFFLDSYIKKEKKTKDLSSISKFSLHEKLFC